jgi:WD40 repeat protein
MQKLKVLIEGNTVGSVHPVEVAADAPIATLVPALVDALQLPCTDLFGKQLVYMLRSSAGGRVFSESASLLDSGVKPGARLALDSYVVDGSVAALENGPGWQSLHPKKVSQKEPQKVSQDVPQKVLQDVSQDMLQDVSQDVLQDVLQDVPQKVPQDVSQKVPPKKNVYASITIPDASDFMIEAGNRSATPPSVPDSIKSVKKGRSTRRAFLITTGVMLGLGGGGLAYAAYQKLPIAELQKALSPIQTQPTIPSMTNTQKTPTKQATNILPTTAKTILTFQGHQQMVRTVAWSPGNMQLASGSDDTNALIWDRQGNIQQTLKHPASVRTLAWSPEGKRLVTGATNQITFFNAQTGEVLAQKQQHTQNVNSVAWAGQGKLQIVSVGADQRAIVWDNQTYQSQITYTKHTIALLTAAWSPDGQSVASGSQGGMIRVWNAENGQDLHGYFRNSAIPLRTLAFAPIGTLLATGGDDGMVCLWNGLTCIDDGARCADVPQRIQVSQQAVRTLAWSPDGRMLAVGTDDGLLSLFAFAQQKPLLFTVQQQTAIRSLAWSPDGKQLALAVGNTAVLLMLM